MHSVSADKFRRAGHARLGDPALLTTTAGAVQPEGAPTAASQISGTVASTVTLGSAEYGRHLTITASGKVVPQTYSGSSGVFVPDSVAGAALLNFGEVSGGPAAIGGVGGAGGIGVDLEARGTVTNRGTIAGGAGGSGSYKHEGGGYGGVGLLLAAGGSVTNRGAILGGEGGIAGTSFGPQGTGGVGVYLSEGGSLFNGGTIRGGTTNYGVYIGHCGNGVNASGRSVVTNAGLIAGGSGADGGGSNGGVGVSLGGGTLINHGTIEGGGGAGGTEDIGFGADGGDGVDLNGGTLVNTGTISAGAPSYGGETYGVAGAGVDVSQGTLLNRGVITGDEYGSGARVSGGVGAYLGSGTIINTGTIIGGTGGDSSYSDGIGVILNGGTLVNAGIVAQGSGGQASYSVQFGTVAATLILDPGAVFSGIVAANSAVADVLELGGTGMGKLLGLGTSFTNFHTLAVAAGSDWMIRGGTLGQGSGITFATARSDVVVDGLQVTGSLNLAGGGALLIGPAGMKVGTTGGVAAGKLTVEAGFAVTGSAVVTGPVLDNGTIASVGSGGFKLAGPVSGSGIIAINPDTLFVAGNAIGTAIEFLGAGAALRLYKPAAVSGTISGFGVAAPETIDIRNEIVSSLTYAATGSASGVLTVSGGGGVLAALHFAGHYSTAQFHHASDGQGGTNITFG